MRLTAFFAMLIVAVFSSLMAVSSIVEDGDSAVRPPRYLAMNGFLWGNAARNQAVDSLVKQQPVKTLTTLAAKESFKREPTSSDAILALGIESRQHRDPAATRRLLLLSRSLNKRDVVTNQLLMDDYLRDQDLKNAMHSIDIMMRSSKPAIAPLAGILSSLLITDEAVDLLYKTLAANPPWAAEFWYKAAVEPKVAMNAGKLRLLQLSHGQANPAKNDIALLNSLVRAREFPLAHELAVQLRAKSADGNVGKGHSGIVNNPDFSQVPNLVPFDWVIENNSQFSAAIAPEEKSLSLSILPNSKRIVVARQLLKLPAGNFRFGSTIAAANPDENVQLQASLRCAENSQSAIASVSLQLNGATLSSFSIGQACSYYWLELAANGSGDNGVADFYIRRLEILPDKS
jgi:hypothetical protein